MYQMSIPLCPVLSFTLVTHYYFTHGDFRTFTQTVNVFASGMVFLFFVFQQTQEVF